MNMKKLGMLALLAVMIIAVVLISGCVGPVEDAPVKEEGEVAIPAEGPPASDVAGEDIPDVPRYPGSVRTDYLREGLILYVTSASIDEVLAFYEKELPANGWTVFGRGQVDYSIVIGADKGNRELMVECSRSEEHAEAGGYIYYGPNYTTYLIIEN